jgi:hypothetical protein
MGLPVDVRDRLALHLKNAFWAESEQEVRMQEIRLEAKQEQFRRLAWPLPRSIQQTLHIIENFRLVEALLGGLKQDDMAEMLRARTLAMQLKSQGVVAHRQAAFAQIHAGSGPENRRAPRKNGLEAVFCAFGSCGHFETEPGALPYRKPGLSHPERPDGMVRGRGDPAQIRSGRRHFAAG